MEMKPTDEAKLGATQGTELEAAVDQNFRGETSEVGLYLAMSRQAYREGYPEVGVRPESCMVLAGGSPARVSAEAPGSRLRLEGEIPPAKRSVKSPVKVGSKPAGRNIK